MAKEFVLITGSSKGLGKELALNFAKEGYNIILHGRNNYDLNNVKKEIYNFGVIGDSVIGDLKNPKTIDKLFEKAEQRDISVLINNAGIFCPEVNFEDISEIEIDDLLGTNLYAPINLSKRIYPLFTNKNFGTIINVNSIIGLEAKKLRSVSCACKYGLRGFTDSLRLEAKDKNINVLGVYPTRIKTRENMDEAMDVTYVSEKIFSAYKGMESELILDGRMK